MNPMPPMKKNFECSDCKTPLAGHEVWQPIAFGPGYCEDCQKARCRSCGKPMPPLPSPPVNMFTGIEWEPTGWTCACGHYNKLGEGDKDAMEIENECDNN